MQGTTHFERLSGWLRGQRRSVERVEVEQGSATHLVDTADYELGRMRADLAGLALEPGTGIARLSQAGPHHADTSRADAGRSPPSAAKPDPSAQTSHDKTAEPKQRRHTRSLADRLRATNSDAA